MSSLHRASTDALITMHVVFYPNIMTAICEATRPDLICIVETWLDDSILDNDISLPNYQLFRLDRKRYGGGIAVYVHRSFAFIGCC